jgi:hypothetical protein
VRLVAVAVYATSLCCTLAVALSQRPAVDADPLGLLPHAPDAPTPKPKEEHPKVTASFDYTRSRQEVVFREAIERLELQGSLQRELELKKLHESPLTTVLDLSRFLTSRGYKRADGSPLIDLTF